MEQAILVSMILLWVLVILLSIAVFALIRQVGVLTERIAPAGALMMNNKLNVGMAAPIMNLMDLHGTKNKYWFTF